MSTSQSAMLLRLARFSLLIALGAVLPLGCAARRAAIDWEEINTAHGVLIVSAGTPETCSRDGFIISINSSTEPFSLFDDVGALQPQNYMIKSDFEEVHAQVHAFAVEPGSYDYWLYSPTLPDPRIEQRIVSVGAGEIVYAGEIWVEGCRAGRVTIKDSWERDQPIVEASYPDLPLDRVQLRIFESVR